MLRSTNPSSAHDGVAEDKGDTPLILFFGSGKGWHGNGVLHSIQKRGFDPIVSPLDHCAFSTEERLGVFVPGLEERRPHSVFVRMVPGGSFEQVTFFLGILHALKELGIPIWNDARAIENCTDKSATTFLLNKAGIATPRSWCGVSYEVAQMLADEALSEKRALVQKPLFGSQGRGLRLVRSPNDLSEPEDVSGVYYLQEFVGDPDENSKDWRLFVCQDRVLAAMTRHSDGWITNVRQGGRAEPVHPGEDLSEIAVRSVKAVGAKYAGVDVVQSPDGRYLVLEVNSMPAWAALQRVTGVKIADLLVDAFLAETLCEPSFVRAMS